VIGAPEGEAGKFCAPCGVCRQVLREFCEPETFRVLLGTTEGVQAYTLAQLLPTSFGPSDLKGE
jgi:cytidine deaminase